MSRDVVVHRYVVIYRDSWGDYAADRFVTRDEAEQRHAYLVERGRVATVQLLP